MVDIPFLSRHAREGRLPPILSPSLCVFTPIKLGAAAGAANLADEMAAIQHEASSPPSPRSPGPSSPLPLGFGLGLGVGLPLALIALVAIIVFRRRNASNRRARSSSSERTGACAGYSSSASDGVTYTQSTEDAAQHSTDHESTTSGPSADVVELGVSRPSGGAPQALDQLDQDNRGLGSARLPSLEDMFWPSPQSRRSSRSSSPVRVLLPAEIPAADIIIGAFLIISFMPSESCRHSHTGTQVVEAS